MATGTSSSSLFLSSLEFKVCESYMRARLGIAAYRAARPRRLSVRLLLLFYSRAKVYEPYRMVDYGHSQFKNNYFSELFSGFEEGSYLRRIDFCITQI